MRDVRFCLLAFALFGLHVICAQGQQSEPVTDSSAQASPLGATQKAPATDTSSQASPIRAVNSAVGRPFAAGTVLHVVLTKGIDSSTLKNGQTIHGKLSSTVTAKRNTTASNSSALVWKAGTPVQMTVIATVPAGKLNAVGEISLQLLEIGNESVLTNVLTYRGEPGPRDLPDSAPTVGTNAGLAAGTALTFVVQPVPTFSEPPPKSGRYVPGAVTGRASGSKPANYGQPTVASDNGEAKNTNAAGSNDPNANTSAGAMHGAAQSAGKQGAASTQQTAQPADATPTTPSQPH